MFIQDSPENRIGGLEDGSVPDDEGLENGLQNNHDGVIDTNE